ncbi:MAG: hypothetical protein J3Q66DRAFT_114074 [Benniella sp.]|nr:MAG: hypothetical protein J3Q66DRAFT_114074 [Benniella sp.]
MTTGQNLTSDDVDPTSGWHKMDRCWVYTIATNEWSVRTLTAAGGKFPSPRRLAALLVVGTKIYMHGGNTTQTVPTDSYASDLWILDTQTWQWTSGPSSSHGRASHTLVHFQDNLLTLSGFEFETTKTRAAQNAFVMVYDLNTTTWGSQFGVVNKTFFQKHGAALIGVSIACFVLVLVIASVMARLWRKYTRGPLPPRPSASIGGLSRKRLNKTSLASKRRSRAGSMTNHSPPDHSLAHAAASRLSDMTIANQHPRSSESKMPRTSESTVYDMQQLGQQQNRHQSFNPYAPVHQQQQVPLMSANALERPSQDFGTYRDDNEPEEKDMRPMTHHSYSGNGDSRSGSFGYVGQPAVLPVVPSHEQTLSGTMAPGPRNQSPTRG